MTQSLSTLKAHLTQYLGAQIQAMTIAHDELTLEINAESLLRVARFLRNDDVIQGDILIDLCAVDYLTYGEDEWSTTNSGFSRGVDASSASRFSFEDAATDTADYDGKRFAVVYHILSIEHNHRIRLKAWCDDNDAPMMDSVIDIWSAANWFEREAFDLFGVLFKGHPDLRRLLTDYGFIGHPFRKDFPLIGHVEMRYDEDTQRVIYQPVTIEPRVLVPRVIRDDVPNPINPAEAKD